MASQPIKTGLKTDPTNILAVLNNCLQKNEPTDLVTWLMLGGQNFMPSKPTSVFDFLLAGTRGIPKLSVTNLATILDSPMKDMAHMLNISYKTLGRKKNTDILDSVTSSLSIEIANTITKGLYVFEDADRLNRWLHKENKALNGQKPFDLLNSPLGIKLVNQVLGRIEEGVYT
jgi:putative toxin-antitoxin system antitoxin component (TIGR02293 family)